MDMCLVKDSSALRLGEDKIEKESQTDPRVEGNPKQDNSAKACS